MTWGVWLGGPVHGSEEPTGECRKCWSCVPGNERGSPLAAAVPVVPLVYGLFLHSLHNLPGKCFQYWAELTFSRRLSFFRPNII